MARIEDQPAALRVRSGKAVTRLSISHLAIAYPWATAIFWIALSAAGIVGFLGLKLALLPNITLPVVTVTAHSNQIDPSVNERTVTEPLEAALGGLRGLNSLHSLTYPEYVVVDMSFAVGADLAAREASVRSAVRDVRLPPGTSLSIATINLNEFPVVTFAATDSHRNLDSLARYVEARIVPNLKAIPGVLKVQVIGAVRSGANASIYRAAGVPALGVSVIKKADANSVDIGEAAAERVAALARGEPGANIVVASTQATFIRETSRATQEALLLAVALAVLVILPFLRDWRATAISALAIPVSLLGTTLVIAIFHFALDTIVLLALALVVGVILDDAIVAVENIVRHLEAGETAAVAALAANKEIGLTLVAASLTVVAVFLPIGLMQGTLGQFFRPFGLTASSAVLFSLLAARTLSPTLAAAWLRRPAAERAVDPNRAGKHPHYRRILGWALAHRPAVVALAIAAFLAGLALIPFIPKGFIPHLDRGEFIVDFQTPLGTPLGDVIATADKLEDAVARDPDVTRVYTSIGAQTGQNNAGTIDVHLRADRTRKTVEIEDAVRKRLPSLDGVVATVKDVPFVGTLSAAPVQFALTGSDIARLRSVGLQMERLLARTPGFVDVAATGLPDGTPFSPIEHVDGKRAVQITAGLLPNFQVGNANDQIVALSKKVVPKGIVLRFGGNSADAVSTFRNFGIALAFSVVAILVVLFALFRSWIDPLAIGISLPLSIVGALFALWITRDDFGIISLMAVIFLFGLVNKNAILLVDRIEKLRALGFPRGEAIAEAGAQRLRPIVMTTTATILGMLPIALGFGAGAELRAPMAVAIIGGLVTSTVLSLVVVPIVYTLLEDLRDRFRRPQQA